MTTKASGKLKKAEWDRLFREENIERFVDFLEHPFEEKVVSLFGLPLRILIPRWPWRPREC